MLTLLASVAAALTMNRIEFGFNPDNSEITAHGVDGIMKIRADRDGIYTGRGSEFSVDELVDLMLNGK